MDLIKEEPEWKKAQRRLSERAKSVFALKPEFNKKGNIIITQSGTKYRIMEDGSWRRVKDGRKKDE